MEEIRAKYVKAYFKRIIAVRLLPGTDITYGLKKVCEDNGILHGYLLMAIGTVNKATVQIFRPRPETKLGAGYTKPESIPGPIEILALSGIIFETEDGEVALHLHGTFCDKDGKLLGGHIVPGGNPVCATLDACLAQVGGARFMTRFDEETGLNLFSPEEAPEIMASSVHQQSS
jgi:predicted DNA-binding protein with PD1-like motif